jgi:hypothetical protein
MAAGLPSLRLPCLSQPAGILLLTIQNNNQEIKKGREIITQEIPAAALRNPAQVICSCLKNEASTQDLYGPPKVI